MSRTLTVAHRTIVAYTKCVSGSLSLIGSALIIRKVLSRKKSDITTYHRILLGMSIQDVPFSFFQALGTLPVTVDSGAIGAHGNTASCATAGFFTQWGNVPPLYMACLSIYFLLKIRCNISDTVISKRYEIFLHAVPWTFGFASSITGLALELFNPLGLPELGCWIGGDPALCPYIPEMECKRGYKIKENNSWYPWIFSFAWLFASVFVVLVCNLLIYDSIRRQERKNLAYGTPREESPPKRRASFMSLESMRAISLSSSNTKMSRAAFVQSMLFVTFAFSTSVWVFLPFLGVKLQVRREVRFFFAIMASLAFPLQGFFNFCVYVRPKYHRLRKEEEISRSKAVWICLAHAP